MTEETRNQSLRAIAFLAEKIRRDTTGKPWNYHGILGALQRGIPTEKTIAEIARAALWFAEHRTKQDTPLMLSEDGRHWHLDTTTNDGVVLPPRPSILTEPMPPPLPPDTIAKFTQQIRSNR